jgi:lysophospholipase L1-like esterase
LIGAAYVLWVGLLCWGGLKVFWWWRFGVGVAETPGVETVWQSFYPELYRSGAMDARLGPDDGSYDVLLLGGSVLEQAAPAFQRALRREFGDRFRLFNLARAAHTSRDSFLKSSHLGNRHFDLVIFYHAINDARMNRCADAAFREDYTHVPFYRAFQARLALGRMELTDFVKRDLAEASPTGTDDATSKLYSGRIKTANAFRHNLEPIVQAAENRHCPIVLMSFAYHLPANYSDDAFRAKRLDYGPSPFGTEISLWGTPDGVRAAMDTHNRVIREVAGRHKNVIFVDQKGTLPADGRHFIDPCHLTEQGNELFVRHVMDALRARGVTKMKSDGRTAKGVSLLTPNG